MGKHAKPGGIGPFFGMTAPDGRVLAHTDLGRTRLSQVNHDGRSWCTRLTRKNISIIINGSWCAWH